MEADLRRLADGCTSTPYARSIGVELVAIAADRVRLRLPHRDDNGNRNGSLHGGVLASLIATTGRLAAGTHGDETHDVGLVDLSVHYIRPVVRTPIVAEAAVARRGREIVFVTVEVATPAGAAVARGVVACRIGGAHAARTSPATSPLALDDVTWRPAHASGSPFTRRMGVRVARLGAGRAVASLPDHPATAGHHGRVHEGALAALVDCAAGAAAWSVVGGRANGRAATVAMHLAFDVTTSGEDVVALATTAWRSGSIVVNDVRVAGRGSGRPVATGSVTYLIARSDE